MRFLHNKIARNFRNTRFTNDALRTLGNFTNGFKLYWKPNTAKALDLGNKGWRKFYFRTCLRVNSKLKINDTNI